MLQTQTHGFRLFPAAGCVLSRTGSQLTLLPTDMLLFRYVSLWGPLCVYNSKHSDILLRLSPVVNLLLQFPLESVPDDNDWNFSAVRNWQTIRSWLVVTFQTTIIVCHIYVNRSERVVFDPTATLPRRYLPEEAHVFIFGSLLMFRPIDELFFRHLLAPFRITHQFRKISDRSDQIRSTLIAWMAVAKWTLSLNYSHR